MSNYDNTEYIAVFSRHEMAFRSVKFIPKDKFIRVMDYKQLMGVKFSGFIIIDDYFRDNCIKNAFEVFKTRHPELFDPK